jgi:hypothetical protein
MRMSSSTDGASGPEPRQFGLAAVSLRGPLRDARYSYTASVPLCDYLGAESVRDSSWTRNAARCLPTSQSRSASSSCLAADASCRDGDCLLQSRVVALPPCVGGRRAVCQTLSVPSRAGRRRGDHSISVPSQPAPSPVACRCCLTCDTRREAWNSSPGCILRLGLRGWSSGCRPGPDLRRAPDSDRCKPEGACSGGCAR